MNKEAIKKKLETPEAKAKRVERKKKKYRMPRILQCSFCLQEKLTSVLIAGPGVYICDECVSVCVEILEEKKL